MMIHKLNLKENLKIDPIFPWVKFDGRQRAIRREIRAMVFEGKWFVSEETSPGNHSVATSAKREIDWYAPTIQPSWLVAQSVGGVKRREQETMIPKHP